MAFNFGVGTLWATRTDITNPTPAMLSTLQSVDLEWSFTLKDLMGQYQAPVAFGRGALKITGKAKYATVSASALQTFLGQTSATGLLATALKEADSVPASSPYTITVTNSSNWQFDLGVIYAATGLALTRVASSPAQGQYSVSSGVYTFASADASAAVLISYTYTASTGGTKITITNQLMGSGPSFQANLATTFSQVGVTKIINVQLNNCMSSKLTMPFKNEDWTIPEFDFQAGADASNNIGYLTVTDS